MICLTETKCVCFWFHRVFKKSSSNGKITVYLGKRDFVDHISHVDPIDGVVLIDPDYVKERKVFGNVLAAFRYGREDLDVLGLTFRKDLYLAQEQVIQKINKWNFENCKLFPLKATPTKRIIFYLRTRYIRN